MRHLTLIKTGLTLLAATCMVGCIHVAGIVRQPSGKPLATAIFSIGRPGGVVYGTHSVDTNGKFDFWIGPEDDTNLYIYDGSAKPEFSIQKLERTSINDRMTIRMFAATSDPDAIIAPE